MAASLRHSAAKRARLAALNAAVSTIALPGLGVPNGIYVLVNGTRLVSKQNTSSFSLRPRAGYLPLWHSGSMNQACPQISTKQLAKGQAGFINGGRENTRFKDPSNVVVCANGNIILSDTGNHAIRVVTPDGR